MKEAISGAAFRAATVALVALGVGATGIAQAQSSRDAFVEEIVVTATKRAGGQEVQDVPVAITALGEEQIDALYLRDLKAIGFGTPNVQLEDIGTTRGVANFSIRGLGINSSIPSIDPTVGVFVDGMYYGINGGVVFDTFDLEAIEVLRGPQGLLFGRNVTGGAVLMRTSAPSSELTVKAKAAVETGNNVVTSGVVSGPLNEAGTWAGKLAVYHNKDGGWFTNDFDGSSFGEADTTMGRIALSWAPSDSFEAILRTETAVSDGDGPASQNGGLFSRDSFDFAIDFPGSYDNEWDQAILEASLDVAFGDGEIVNILAWRDYESASSGDIDASPFFLFHSRALTQYEQVSNELRYSGNFGNMFVTSGLYYFTGDLDYREERNLIFGTNQIVGGGLQDQSTWGIFTQVDYQLTDTFTINIGGRYSAEDKDVQIATLGLGLTQGAAVCTIENGCSAYNLVDKEDWSSFTPKIGFQWAPNDATQVYGFYTRGFRSGGYNLRNTSPTASPGPFDEEKQDSYELGIKTDLLDGKARINAAVFYNQIDDMQREVNLSDPVAGVVQIIDNTADATIQGFDLEGRFFVTDSITATVNAGYVDGQYDKVLFDISGDGVVNEADKRLDLPRLAPWSYGASLIYDRDLGNGMFFNGLVSFNHRDQAPYTDNNLGLLKEADMLDASLSLIMMEGSLKLSVYGKNLKDEVQIGGDTQLPAIFAGGPLAGAVLGVTPGPGATFSPLNKGRIVGMEIQYSY